ncbi:cytochrome c [Brevibacillus nitrificans]|uniref:Cytochrome c n=1 Tax=Brevibacillus nitrificans TaxID=651560 RepID=A0A3M8DRK1_9BACL|nr:MULTISPECIES: cytochrome c [Brevibacillus]MED1952384.1 cytochrome c [Brevibacillus centrosporus]RNB90085.1 cytochrome c [Brevibacillus nitrificans]
MKRSSLFVVAAVLVFSLSACGGGNTAQPPANQPSTETPSTTAPSGSYDAATAEALFKNTCAGCHGQTLEGAVGPNLQKVGGQLNKDQILEILNNGKGAMPPGLVKGADAETLAAWLADKK